MRSLVNFRSNDNTDSDYLFSSVVNLTSTDNLDVINNIRGTFSIFYEKHFKMENKTK